MPTSSGAGSTRSAVVVLGKKPPRAADIHPEFAANLRAAANVVRATRSALLVISGGTTRRGRDPEAVVGLELVRNHVTAPIMLELESRTTAENILNARLILENGGFGEITFVTSAYHLRRTRLLVARLWPEASGSARYAHGEDTDSLAGRAANWLYLPVAALDPSNRTVVRVTRRLYRNG